MGCLFFCLAILACKAGATCAQSPEGGGGGGSPRTFLEVIFVDFVD